MSTRTVGAHAPHRLVGISLLLAVVGALIFGAFNGPALRLAHADGIAGLDWGVKESFRNYISGPIAHGQVTLSDGATQNPDGTYHFPSAGPAVEEGDALTASYEGAVLFQGHKGVGVPADQYALELAITNIRLTRTGDTGGIIADVVSRGLSDGQLVEYPDVELATLDYTGITPGVDGGLMTLAAVPAALTEAGVPAFASFYSAGTAVDPVTFAYTTVTEDASLGLGTWGIRTSYRNYINGPIAHGSIVASDGAVWLDGAGNAKGPFTWPVASATYDAATGAGEVTFAGSVYSGGHDYGQGFILESEWSNLRLEIDGTTGTLYADLEFRPFVGANPSIPPPPVENATNVAFANVDLSGVDWTADGDGFITITNAPAVGVTAAMELIGWDLFYSGEMPNPALDALSVTFLPEAGEPEPEPTPSVTVVPNTDADPAGQDFTITGEHFAPTGTGIYIAFGPDPALNPEAWSTDAGLYQTAIWLNAAALAPDGGFERVIEGMTAVYTDAHGAEVDCHVVSCGFVTMKAHGVPDRTQDTFTPVTFAEPAVVWEPKIELSKSTDIDPAGETITVTGSGFDPSANIGTRPPFSGQPAGVYVIFGKFDEVWQPSTGAASGTRRVIAQKWAVPPAIWANVGGTNPQYIPLNADGTFTAQLSITPNEALAGNYAVVTYPGSGAVNAGHELYVPISFATVDEPTPIGDVIPNPEDIDPDVTPVSDVVDDGETLTLGDGLVTATFDDPDGGTGKVLLAKYADGALGVDGVIYDIHFAPTSSTGANATLTVTLTGLAPDQALSYFDGEAWAAITSNDGTPAVTDENGTVTVVFGPNSTPTLLGLGGTPIGTLDEGEPLAAPVVTEGPQDVSVTVPAGGSQSVTFTANATGNPVPTVVWQLLPAGSSTWITLGETATTFTLDASIAGNGTQYRAVFTNSEGSAATNPATLTVTEAVESAATVAIDLDQSSVTAGGQVTGTVSATTETPIAGIEFQFSFDPAKLQVASITGAAGWSTINCAPEGDPNQCLVQIDNTAGTVRAVFFRFAPNAPVSGEGLAIATIVFNAIGATEATSVDLESAILSTADGLPVAPVELVDSDDLAIEPAERIISGTVLLQGRTDHSGTTVYFGGYSAVTSASGAFVIEVEDGTEGTLVAIHDGYLRAVGTATTVTADVAAAEIMLRGGDATGDGAVNIFDLALIAGHYGETGPWALGNGSSEPEQAITPDINGVDGVNLFDLTIAAGNYGLAAPSAWALVP